MGIETSVWLIRYNFAFSGATVASDIVPPYATFVRTLTDQIDELVDFTMSHDSKLWKSSNTLFSIWVSLRGFCKMEADAHTP
jgi:hypothetical protein